MTEQLFPGDQSRPGHGAKPQSTSPTNSPSSQSTWPRQESTPAQGSRFAEGSRPGKASRSEGPPAGAENGEGDNFIWPSRRKEESAWPDSGERDGKRRSSGKASSKTSAVEEIPRGRTSGDGDQGDDEGGTRRKAAKKTRRRRRPTTASDEEPAAEPNAQASGEPSQSQEDDGDGEGGINKKSRRRGKRGGRRRKKTEDEAEEAEGESGDLQPKASEERGREQAAESDEDKAPRSRKRGSRGGRGRKKSAAVEVEGIPGEEDDLPDLPELPDDTSRVSSRTAASGRKGRVTSSRRKKTTRSVRGRDDEEEAKPVSGRSKATAKKVKKKTKMSKKTRWGAGEEEEEEVPALPEKPRQILVNAADPEETRVVVVEEGRIVDLQMTSSKHANYVSDIYRGRVVNLEPAIGAAFVDFGQGKNGFLHASDVLPCYGDKDFQLDQLLTEAVDDDAWSSSSQTNISEEIDEEEEEEDGDRKGGDKKGRRGGGRKDTQGRNSGRPRRPRTPIEKLVKKGQMLCVQITKDAIGDKGPTLTTYISIPGRYLVLMPSLARTGVSRKIDDDRERRRLKRILTGMEIPDGMGVIVRTAGVGRTKADLKRDLDYLLAAWEDFSRRLVSGRNPAPLYQESDIAIKTMRDLFTPNVEAVYVDDPEVHQRVVEFTRKLMPEHEDRIKLEETPHPILQSHGVEPDFEKLFSKRVELPSGGSIVIEQTEALVAIDVNSGRTREDGAGFEDIALKTNLEATPEIARQIRLRDLGGIIVLDYIDMMRTSSRRAVERATREGLSGDRARSKVGRISQFGLLELTRQRLGPGLDKLVYETCRSCRGTGRRRSASSRAQAILRRLGASLSLKGFTTVEVRAHPDAIECLKTSLSRELDRLEDDSGRKIVLMSAPDQVEDSVLHYLRADGREVRPGGRRKKR
ncbi:MAG: ribonuclease E [Gammaproteobacteria bacterium]|jgi:ribonuclease E